MRAPRTNPVTVAAHVRASPVRKALVAALDDWAAAADREQRAWILEGGPTSGPRPLARSCPRPEVWQPDEAGIDRRGPARSHWLSSAVGDSCSSPAATRGRSCGGCSSAPQRFLGQSSTGDALTARNIRSRWVFHAWRRPATYPAVANIEIGNASSRRTGWTDDAAFTGRPLGSIRCLPATTLPRRCPNCQSESG